MVTSKLEQRTFLLMLTLATVLFLWLLIPFFAPVFWAVVVAMLFHPVQQRLTRAWGDRPNLTAGVTLLLGLVGLVIPALVLLTALVSEGVNVYQRVQSGEWQPGEYVDLVKGALPPVQAALDQLNIDVDRLREGLSEGAIIVSRFIAQNAVVLGQSTFGFFLKLLLMLYLTFFLLRDGRQLVFFIAQAIPLSPERKQLLFGKFVEATRATVRGTLVVAAVQGALGGFIFWVLGIPAALLWGVVMGILSLLPAVGAFVVWMPVAVYLFATGEVVSAIVLVVFGAAVIGLADNLLRPILIGRDTKLPDWLILLSTLGGLMLLGIHGFVLGPLIAVLFVTFWQIFSRDFNGASAVPEPETEEVLESLTVEELAELDEAATADKTAALEARRTSARES